MEKYLTVEYFFGLFPYWYIAACFITGFVVFPIMLALAARPLARGLSHGLWETVVYWKAGVPIWKTFKRLLRAFWFDLWFWHLINSTLDNESIGGAYWWGVFGWSFKKEFTRANSTRKQATKG